MTIDTIKNVLSRIMTINQNLNEESLHTLLIASGWDEQDIREGVNIFKSVRGGADINNYEPIINEEEIRRVNKNSEGKERERVTEETNTAKEKKTKELDAKIPKTTAADFIFPFHSSENKEHTVLQSLREKILDASENRKEEEGENITNENEGDHVIENFSFAPSVGTSVEKIKSDNNDELISGKRLDDDEEEDLPSTRDMEKKYDYYKERPIGLIVLDAVLFVIVLSLIVYILFN